MGDRSLKTLQTALLGASFLIAVAGSASAADIYKGGSLKDAPVPYVPAITWTGFYFGVNAGAAFGDRNASIDWDEFETEHFKNDDSSFIGGLHVGYNWQKPGGWVFGIEGDVNFADEIDYLATIRGRLGYAMDSTLIYATGGAAFIGADDAFEDSDSETGWVAGLGIEHKIKPNFSIGLEGLYYDFGNGDDFRVVDEFGNEGDAHVDDLTFWTIRARLTYHFGERYEDALK
jgi:outer membrane immunogenic protein